MIRKRSALTTSQRKQCLFWGLFGVILLGTALHGGRILLGESAVSWTRWIGDFFAVEWTLSSLFLAGIRGAILFLLVFFLLGVSAIGQPFALLLLCSYGFCIGGNLLLTGGTAFRVICLLPYIVPVSALMALAARESLRFSCKFSVYGFRDEPSEQMMHALRMYCVRFAVLFVLLLVTALLYSVAFYAFAVTTALHG